MMPLSSKTVDVGMSEIGLFDAIYTTSGVVGVKPDPVEEEKIKRILDAAIRAPSGNNAQP
jgi:nitroreductase